MFIETCRLKMPDGESYEQKRALSVCLIGHVLDKMISNFKIADYKPTINKSAYVYPILAPDFNVEFRGKNFGLYVAVNDNDFSRIVQIPGVNSPIIRVSTEKDGHDIIIHPRELARSIEARLKHSNNERKMKNLMEG